MWRRLGLVLAGVLVAATLLEIGLRAAAAFTRGRAGGEADGAPTIVCLGDSNTYGVYVEPEETYPKRLEALLRPANPGVRVVNLGVPGRSSREIRETIDEALERWRPEVVLVLVGVNDLWSEASRPRGPLARFASSLRIVRLARILRSRAAPPDGIVDPGAGGREFRVPGREGEAVLVRPTHAGPETAPDALAGRLSANLGAIAAAARAAGGRAAFLTYGPEDGRLAEVNAAIRAFCRSSGAGLIDASPVVADLARRGWYTEFYFADFHPRPRGYELLARIAADGLAALGFAAGERVGDLLAGLEPERELPTEALARDRSAPAIRLVGSLAERETLALEIDDAPGLRYQVLLSFADPPPWTKALSAAAFSGDPLFTTSLESRLLGGSFDAQGHARVDLGAFVGASAAEARGRRLRVAYLVRAYDGDPWVRGVSGTVAFDLR